VREARDKPGGLAGSIELEGLRFDCGPYVLLDRPGLEWAFEQLQITLADRLQLNRIPDVYEIDGEHEPTVHIFDSLDDTANGIERQWPGSGDRYRKYIRRMQATYARLQPLQWISRPGVGAVLRTGAWRELPFIMRSLNSVLNSTQLPDTVTKALGIWTHVAGQTSASAPSPLAMVPAVIHTVGAYYPSGGIGAVPTLLFEHATELGVRFYFASRVKRIRCASSAVFGVETEDGDFYPAGGIISNVGVGTYLKLLDDTGVAAVPARMRRKLSTLPLQSPGVCAYLAVKGTSEPPYLRFQLRDELDGCRLLVTPQVVEREVTQDGWAPARLIAPMRQEHAESGGEPLQREFLERVLAESWWREKFEEVRVVATRVPQEWGSTFHLFRNSMNPVMTAEFMRTGRLAHRSPWIHGLYLTGSATHPGQWVSFCAVSGVLTANRVLNDLES
jgi:phytoene desaturase